MERQWKNIIWPCINDCDFTVVLDLAAGHGRNSAQLIGHAQKLYVTDIVADNIEVCSERFKHSPIVETFVGNGYDFQPMEDESLTFIYCFDAMVHFDSDVVRSYLKDTRRVLKPGGRAFYHHSNYTGGHDWRTNPGGRNFMSTELFAHYAHKEDLAVVHQKATGLNSPAGRDCLTLVAKGAGSR